MGFLKDLCKIRDENLFEVRFVSEFQLEHDFFFLLTQLQNNDNVKKKSLSDKRLELNLVLWRVFFSDIHRICEARVLQWHLVFWRVFRSSEIRRTQSNYGNGSSIKFSQNPHYICDFTRFSYVFHIQKKSREILWIWKGDFAKQVHNCWHSNDFTRYFFMLGML